MKTKNLVQLLGALFICLGFASCTPPEPSGGGEKPANENYGTITDLSISPEVPTSDKYIYISTTYDKGKKSISAVGSYSCSKNGKVVKEESDQSMSIMGRYNIALQLEAGTYEIKVNVTETIEGESPRTMTKTATFTVKQVDFKGSTWGESMEATETFLKSKSIEYTRSNQTITATEKIVQPGSKRTRTTVYTYNNNALVSMNETDLTEGHIQEDRTISYYMYTSTNRLVGEEHERFSPFTYVGEITPGSTLNADEQHFFDLYNQGKIVDDLSNPIDTAGVFGKAVRDGKVVLKANGSSPSTVGNSTTELQNSSNETIVIYKHNFHKK